MAGISTFDWPGEVSRLRHDAAEVVGRARLLPSFAEDGTPDCEFPPLRCGAAAIQVWRDMLASDDSHWLFELASQSRADVGGCRFVLVNVALHALLLEDPQAFRLISERMVGDWVDVDIADGIRWRMAGLARSSIRSQVRPVQHQVARACRERATVVRGSGRSFQPTGTPLLGSTSP
jgi:hypothetical protein